MWLTFVIVLITSTLLGHEHGMISVSWNLESIIQALEKETEMKTSAIDTFTICL